MKSKQTLFFALLGDIEPILKSIEANIDLQYVTAGLMNQKDITKFDSIFQVSNIGYTVSGDWNKISSYIVIKKDSLLNIRSVPQRSGDIKYAIDQMKNPKSIEFKIGGVYKGQENVIVAGRISTISEDKESNEIYNLFSTKIKKDFRKIAEFYVGKEAEEKLKLGWRLVTNERLSKEFDLK